MMGAPKRTGGDSMKNILEYLEHSVGRRPEKTACADTDTSMTWRQLREASARIGSLLLKHRLTHRPVAVYMEKTPACLAAMLGTVYGGDFYTVIDTKMPWDRIRKIFIFWTALIEQDDSVMHFIVNTDTALDIGGRTGGGFNFT